MLTNTKCEKIKDENGKFKGYSNYTYFTVSEIEVWGVTFKE